MEFLLLCRSQQVLHLILKLCQMTEVHGMCMESVHGMRAPCWTVLAQTDHRTALVGREFDRYKVDIAALSEIRLAEEGLLKQVGAGYTFFWSVRKKEERREAGVGFAINSYLVSRLSGLPKGINDRLMTLRLLLSGKRHATIVSAYASTMINPDEVKDKFYGDLDSVISAAPRTDKHPPGRLQC